MENNTDTHYDNNTFYLMYPDSTDASNTSADPFKFNLKLYLKHTSANEEISLIIFSTYTFEPLYFLEQYKEISNHNIVIFHDGSISHKESIPDNIVTCTVAPTFKKFNSAVAGDVIRSGGVHHPKYILIFTRLRLHVIIMTANLVTETSLNTCWISCFNRLALCNSERSEFGVILEDFVLNVSEINELWVQMFDYIFLIAMRSFAGHTT
jgi:hypothetical protein